MLDKRKCREFADPGLKMAAGCGLLHAEQVGYIIRTAVRIISRHKTLLLYVCPRVQAARGDFRPRWTVFQAKDDFTTLERREDGSTAWRTAAFGNLGEGYGFTRECAFYSQKDGGRVTRYLKTSHGDGIKALAAFQAGIQERRRRERQERRENKILSRMEGIPALPADLESWIHKSIMPAYFFYDYKRGSRDVPGVCTSCGNEILLSGVRQGEKGICPRCGRELAMKPRSRRGRCMTDRDTCQVIQDMGDGELAIRILKVYYTYTGDTPGINIYENARQFIHVDPDGKVRREDYYDSCHGGILTNWKEGLRPVYYRWQYHFEADTCGHLYTGNLPAALKDTPWRYCPVAQFYGHFHEPLQLPPFLAAYLGHPRLEHLVKTGFFHIVSDIVYSHHPECLDESQDRTHRILKVSAEDVPFLRELDAGISTLQAFQGYAGLKGRRELLLWQTEHGVSRGILQILRYMTAHKFIRYMDRQYGFLCPRGTPNGTARYRGMQDLVSEYRDYLEMCAGMGYDMKSSFVLYPKDLQEAHDQTARRSRQKKDALVRRKFTDAYRKLLGKFDFEKNGLKIVYPAVPEDITAEGHALHHCVGSYVERAANGECVILFLRRCADESRPYYTVEIRGREVIQVRGACNCGMTPEVRDFIKDWEQSVLCTRLPAGAA